MLRPKPIKLKKTHVVISLATVLDDTFVSDTKNNGIKNKINKWDHVKLKASSLSKGDHQKMKWQPTE